MNHFYQNFNNWFNYSDLYRSTVSRALNNSHFVEIGTYKGASAAFMAVEIINSKKNIKFDTYDIFDTDSYERHRNSEEEARNNLSPVKDFVNVFKCPSAEASKKYQDESLDFVFIDGSHLYDDILDDIRNWYPKVKKGAILSGHDLQPKAPQVEQAVVLFCKENNLPSFKKVSTMCWLIQK